MSAHLLDSNSFAPGRSDDAIDGRLPALPVTDLARLLVLADRAELWASIAPGARPEAGPERQASSATAQRAA